MPQGTSIIIKFEESTEQTVGSITKIVGLVPARFFVSIIDSLNLEANPRSSRTGAVTDAIQETISSSPQLFPFMSKGVLLASSNYEKLERGRIKLLPSDPRIEGILDGGHQYIGDRALYSRAGAELPWRDIKFIIEKLGHIQGIMAG